MLIKIEKDCLQMHVQWYLDQAVNFLKDKHDPVAAMFYLGTAKFYIDDLIFNADGPDSIEVDSMEKIKVEKEKNK